MLKFHIPTFIFAAVNLFILYKILKWLLFKPVTQFMDNRTNMIKNSLENAEKVKVEAEALKKDLQLKLNASKEEAAHILEGARVRANKEYEAMMNTTKKEAQALMERARQEIAREREQMLKQVKNEVASLALAAASKVLEANMDTESNRVLVDKFLDKAGAA